MYKNVRLFIDGQWKNGGDNEELDVVNPSTGQNIGTVACATKSDLSDAVEAAARAFKQWRDTGAFDRYNVMRRAADIVRSKAEEIATLLTIEQGKPFGEAKAETLAGAALIDWFAEEGRRTYGRIIPARTVGVQQLSVREPVGPVAAFTPWNFPINQSIRKVGAALATGCTVILKGSEDTPACVAAIVAAFDEAGLPAGCLNLVFGNPAEISEYLVPHPKIRKISFTGSTPVGKHLASIAGLHMKRMTMELGGHAPAIVFDDADIETAAQLLAFHKFRNAGQICIAPTRFLVQSNAVAPFLAAFKARVKAIKVGDGFHPETVMGPLVRERRIASQEELVQDALKKGARLEAGGERQTEKGAFFQPTILTHIPLSAKVMHDEPFGPLALVQPFDTLEQAILEANRLPYGLAAYAFTRSLKTAEAVGREIESGMVSINHFGLSFPELPFGGVKDSGFGSEGGTEAMEPYLVTKLISIIGA